MLVACFWPFEFHPHNDVVHVPGRGLRFHGTGTAYSRDSFPSLRQLSESGELAVEMTIRPSRIFNSGLPSVFSIAADTGTPALVIGAWKKSLIVRLGRPGNPGWKKYYEIGVGDVFAAGQTVHLVISLGPQGTTIFVDGRFKRSSPATIANLDASFASLGRLLLGNSPTGGSLWRGEILALALYDRALTLVEIAQGAAAGALPDSLESAGSLIARYRFDKIEGNLIPNTSGPRYDIIIPTYFSPLRRTVLELPGGNARLTLSFLMDIVLNILGFMPFGFLAMLSLGAAAVNSLRRQSTLVVLAGFSLSLGIELIQVLIPTRSSSLIDSATNTLGTALGVLVFFILSTRTPEGADEEVPIS